MCDIDIDLFLRYSKNINILFCFNRTHLSFTTSFSNFFARTENYIIESYTKAGTILNCDIVNSMH